MRPGFVVSGVLGIGTVVVFGAAALVSTLFPNGTTVAAGWNGGMMWTREQMFVEGGVAVPVPAPGIVDDGGGVLMSPEPAPAEQ